MVILTKNFEILDEDIIYSDEMIDCINNIRKCKDYPKEIEDKLCMYLESVFSMAKKEYEDELEHQQKKLESSEKNIDAKKNKGEKLESEIKELQRKIGKETFQVGRRRRIVSIVQVLSVIILLVLCERQVIKILFINWVGKSLDVVNAPLDPSSPEAGSEFGNGILNFLAIPFKCIVGAAIFIGVALVVWFILSMILNQSRTKLKKS